MAKSQGDGIIILLGLKGHEVGKVVEQPFPNLTDETDTVLVDVTHGIPARRIKSKAALEALDLEKKGAPLEEIVKVLSGERVFKAFTEGDIDGGAFGCGQVIGIIHEILTAQEIIEGIISEAASIIGCLGSLAAKA